MQEDDLDAAFSQNVDKGHVVDAGLLDPKDVVEQQAFCIGGRQPRHFRPRPVAEDAAQLTGFGTDAIGQGHGATPW